jgi:hypothetical protein
VRPVALLRHNAERAGHVPLSPARKLSSEQIFLAAMLELCGEIRFSPITGTVGPGLTSSH